MTVAGQRPSRPQHRSGRVVMNRALRLAVYARASLHRRTAVPQDSVAIVENFWREVWKQPQNPDAIDRLVHESFVITSGGRDIVGRAPFKAWVKDFQARVTTSNSMFSRPSRIRTAAAWPRAG